MPSDNVTYTTTSGASKWRRTGDVVIVSVHDTHIGSFPMSFLRTCGDNTWQYILHVIHLVIEVDPDHPGKIVDNHGEDVRLAEVPAHGSYIYLEQGTFTIYLISKSLKFLFRQEQRRDFGARTRILQYHLRSFRCRGDHDV